MDWINTANGLIALITGLIGLMGTGVGAFFAVKNFILATKEKSAKENWALICKVADAAMQEAEKSGKNGSDKKQIVIDTVKTSCKAAGVNLDTFIDQLTSYIDDCINFANRLNKNKGC